MLKIAKTEKHRHTDIIYMKIDPPSLNRLSDIYSYTK